MPRLGALGYASHWHGAAAAVGGRGGSCFDASPVLVKNLKENAAVVVEAQRGATQDLLAGFAPLFAGVTEQLKRAVDMQGQLV